jgi:uncharacterized Tic20 family protein
MKYDELKKLDELRLSGALTEQEFQREKAKLLGDSSEDDGLFWGMNEKSYAMCLHLSQFLGFVIPVFGVAMPIVMWLLYKDKNEFIAENGRNVVNWVITNLMLLIVLIPACFVLIGIPLLIILFVLDVTFCIIGAIKAGEGTAWKYPLSAQFIK